jgi:hypothetical protein
MPTTRARNKSAAEIHTATLEDQLAMALQRSEIYTYAAYRDMLAGWAQTWVKERRVLIHIPARPKRSMEKKRI